jgi:hypothetical protein
MPAIGDLRPEDTRAVVLDADALGTRDIIDLERFLARPGPARLVLLGEDAGRRGVRGLLRHERARWIAWPPDIEDLQAIAELGDASPAPAAGDEWNGESSRAGRPPAARPAAQSSAPPRPAQAGADAPLAPRHAGARVDSALSAEIAEIERVLGELSEFEVEESIAPATALESEKRTVDAAPEERAAPSPEVGPAAHAPAPRPGESFRADSFRSQVADLADIAQRIEISLLGLREAHEDASTGSASSAALEEVGREVARLVQFARTLGYLVAPPGPGAQSFDLTEMLELFLSEIRGAGPDAPRCLLRSNGALPVRSDRQLLSQAFDALFFVARSAAARGEIVRVQARRDESSSPPWARISIDFPAGRLLEVPAETILEPYGLRRILPELGPNALSAAVRIIEGQGGLCQLEPLSRGRWSWNVALPLAPAGLERVAPVLADGAGAANARAARPEDPFA